MHRRTDATSSDSKSKSESRAKPSNASGSTACDSRSHGCTQSLSRSELIREPLTGDMGTNTNNTGPSSARDALIPHNRLVVTSMKLVGATLVLLYFIIPAFVKIYPAVILNVAFLNHFRWPPFINLDKPDELGLNWTRNFRLETAPEITVGAWHILPEPLGSNLAPSDDKKYIDSLKDDQPIILYLHGNAGTRAAWHRVQLYKVLSKAGFHVVTFDYRGYGDSTGYPTEDGLVDDSLSVFKWVRSHSGESPIYIWGHSLGSAVATRTAKMLNEAGVEFTGLVLESPFNNFVDAASNHPFTTPFRVLPWFTWVFIEGIKTNNILFASDEHIGGVKAKTLVLHATDDGVVPYDLGRKLYDAAVRTKKDNIEFVTFDGVHGYGHKHIHKAPNLPEVIRKFTSVSKGSV